MKKIIILLASTLTLTGHVFTLDRDIESTDLNVNIPLLAPTLKGYEKVPDVAQYGGADWSNVIGIAKGITLSQARDIADQDPNISYFFFTKGYSMVLTPTSDTHRIFYQGDAVFFSGKPWWGSAKDLADGYVKIQ